MWKWQECNTKSMAAQGIFICGSYSTESPLVESRDKAPVGGLGLRSLQTVLHILTAETIKI